ncbi:peptidase domain-containing ABC transporter [Prochlorococcus marinus]|uniref:Toxin secretion ABC transporter ATP-binding protein n=1 Tax=Prochlorococcus marinus str. PAC1 TaxID=59924 RepID=A0A0A2C8M2_PROMR|nr:peptidase domain-containing ABC transporter [Prochlorococcus marinus]KGG21887.1 Toxin secretion ABC transporter ATP-binding protein [Prochlorococcus marinus str. PAC1]
MDIKDKNTQQEQYLRKIIQEKGEKIKFKIGQSICEKSYLPGYIFLIESGVARLIDNAEGRLTTLKKLKRGSIIGLSSILRGISCEDVRASTEVIAWRIDDLVLKDIYDEDKIFNTACNQYIGEAERIELRKIVPNSLFNLESNVNELNDELFCNAFLYEKENDRDLNNFIENHYLFLGSKVENKDIGSLILSKSELIDLTSKEDIFQTRIICILKSICNANNIPKLNNQNNINTNENIQFAPRKVPVSSFQRFNYNDNLLIKANGELHEILACFEMLSKILDVPIKKDSIEKILRERISKDKKIDTKLIGQIAIGLGLHVSSGIIPANMGTRLHTPSVIILDSKYVLVVESNKQGIVIASPSEGFINLSPDKILSTFKDGINILLIDKNENTPNKKFGLEWFWPAIKNYKNILIQVLVASFVVQMFTLANPLLIQVIIDKVINQRSLDTLQVLGIALLFITILEGVLGSLKTFLFAETTNRIDQRLGAEVIDHLLRLPLNYFDKRPVGELSSRVDELEKIRSFLTGQALTTILDAAFSVIYILIMFLYSTLLTFLALSVVPIQILLTLLGAPLFRRQFRQSAEAKAKTQSHLVEVLTGIQTVKSQNVEISSRWKWQDLYGKYINRTFERIISGTTLSQTSQVLQKMSQLLVLWIGASLVLEGKLTLGQLIAFRIISSYVTQPLLRLSNIWQDIQELRVSFERLGDVIDTPQESNEKDKQNIPLPKIEGLIKFDKVNFSFANQSQNTLNEISLNVEPGKFIGVVGQSGSGKSTLMKLLSRLYEPKSGKILIDGYDISKVEIYSLRRQIGIVPQEPLLFSGSISENIALTDTDSSSDEIVKAARLADAHEFIMSLPNGYSSDVGERGSSLSGGQRQRIALARTLLSNPKLLILDEATSALDYETERRVCDNLLDNINNKTIFFVTHRINTIRRAEKIILMHQGRIDESGTHEELMNKRGRYYALYQQQEIN